MASSSKSRPATIPTLAPTCPGDQSTITSARQGSAMTRSSEKVLAGASRPERRSAGSKPCKQPVLFAVRCALWLLSSTVLCGAALAEDQPGGAEAGPAAGAGLEEIVVTAQRRTEKLQDVPIS